MQSYQFSDASKTRIRALRDDGVWLEFLATPGLGLYDEMITSNVTPTDAAPTTDDVDAERSRRMALFTFQGKAYDFDSDSQTNIAGAGTLAFAAIVNGKQPGDLRWADADRDFGWIAHDNTVTLMDAPTCFAFATAAANYKSALILKARTIKNLSPIPADFANDARWT